MSSSCWHLCDHSHNSLVCNRLVYIAVTSTGYQHQQGIFHFWLFCVSITSVNCFILLNVCKYLAQIPSIWYNVWINLPFSVIQASYCLPPLFLINHCEYVSVSVFVSFEILFPHPQDLCLDFYFLN